MGEIAEDRKQRSSSQVENKSQHLAHSSDLKLQGIGIYELCDAEAEDELVSAAEEHDGRIQERQSGDPVEPGCSSHESLFEDFLLILAKQEKVWSFFYRRRRFRQLRRRGESLIARFRTLIHLLLP